MELSKHKVTRTILFGYVTATTQSWQDRMAKYLHQCDDYLFAEVKHDIRRTAPKELVNILYAEREA